MANLTSVEGVKALMASSKNSEEWDANSDKVKAANGGYPSFWHTAIVMSGLMDETLGNGSSKPSIEAF